jgi:OOP family OmpA-OmpF porin
MRRLLTASLFLAASVAMPRFAHAQFSSSGSTTLAGSREFGFFLSGRVLSDEYSAATGKTAFGGALAFATHLSSILAVQGGLAGNYSRQEYSYYKPPLYVFTPSVSLLIQRATGNSVQPYAVVGAGYEFVHYTHPRCDCDQSRSLGVANVGLGMRKMMNDRRALRFEVSSQIGKGGPAFTGLAGMSIFVGSRNQPATNKRPPSRVRPEPPVIRPVERATVTPAAPPAAPPPAAVPNNPVPSNTVRTSRGPEPLPTGVNAVLFQVDGTQVDFSKPNWRTDAEPLLDALVVDLTSDAGQKVKVVIEAHTDNVGSNAGNIMLGLDRARAVRDYLVSQGGGADRIRVESAGEDQPVAPNTTAIGRQQNRRIIIKRDN